MNSILFTAEELIFNLKSFEILIYTGWGTGTVPPTVVEGGQLRFPTLYLFLYHSHIFTYPQISQKSVEKRVRAECSKTGRASVVRGSFDLAYWGFSSPTKNFITLSYEVILYIKGRILVAE